MAEAHVKNTTQEMVVVKAGGKELRLVAGKDGKTPDLHEDAPVDVSVIFDHPDEKTGKKPNPHKESFKFHAGHPNLTISGTPAKITCKWA